MILNDRLAYLKEDFNILDKINNCHILSFWEFLEIWLIYGLNTILNHKKSVWNIGIKIRTFLLYKES